MAKARDIPKACSDKTLPVEQRIDICLSDEWDKDSVLQGKNPDKAAYMNDEKNRSRAKKALK